MRGSPGVFVFLPAAGSCPVAVVAVRSTLTSVRCSEGLPPLWCVSLKDGDLGFPAVLESLGADTDRFGSSAGASSYLSKVRLARVSSRPNSRLVADLIAD